MLPGCSDRSGSVMFATVTPATLIVAVTLPASIVTTEGFGMISVPFEFELKGPASLSRWNAVMVRPCRPFNPDGGQYNEFS